MEKYDTAGQATDDNKIRRMRTACWTTKATDTQSEYVTLIVSTTKAITRTRLNIPFIRTLPVLILELARILSKFEIPGIVFRFSTTLDTVSPIPNYDTVKRLKTPPFNASIFLH